MSTEQNESNSYASIHKIFESLINSMLESQSGTDKTLREISATLTTLSSYIYNEKSHNDLSREVTENTKEQLKNIILPVVEKRTEELTHSHENIQSLLRTMSKSLSDLETHFSKLATRVDKVMWVFGIIYTWLS